ncbi:MAG: hypothetical protein RMA76_38220 [Deltaproteobacteria bacterium]
MGWWVRLETSLPRHAKTRKLREALGVSRAEAIGWAAHLLAFAGDVAPSDGDLTDYGPEGLEEEMRWRGEDGKLFAAYVEAGFLDHVADQTSPESRSTKVHNWERYASLISDGPRKSSKSRSDQASADQAAARARDGRTDGRTNGRTDEAAQALADQDSLSDQPDPSSRADAAKVAALYNDLCGPKGFKPVQRVSANLRARIAARTSEIPAEVNALAWWRGTLTKAAESRFLREGAEKGWCNLDWLTGAEKCGRLRSGAYDDRDDGAGGPDPGVAAWERVMGLVRKRIPIGDDDPVLHDALKAIGGVRSVGDTKERELGHLRRRFLAIYKERRERGGAAA